MEAHKGPKVDCLIGGQYGSEGKGVIAGYIADEYDVAVRVGAPNAGHTLVLGDKKWKLQQLPIAGLVNPDCALVIGPAGLINMEVLKREMELMPDIQNRLFIDRNAGILEDCHRQAEEDKKMFEGIGSTCEGVGEAMQAKIRRDGKFRTAKDMPELQDYIINVPKWLNSLGEDKRVMIEGTQGFSLSMNHGPYPFCTSRDILASSLLSDVGISPKNCDKIIMVIRTYPIRVAGNSGPMYSEMTWEEVTKEAGYPTLLQEKTTVTKRIRRVGRFDIEQVVEACMLNRPTELAITFADYIDYGNKGVNQWDKLTASAQAFVNMVEDQTGVPVTMVKTGIEYEAIIDRQS